MPAFRDRTGERYGRLVAICEAPREKRTDKVKWLCRCDCGNEVVKSGTDMVPGRTQSCGCLQREKTAETNATRAKHGHTRASRSQKRKLSPEYNSWKAMLQRCKNPNAPNFHLYGGRGIAVCDRWLDFTNFLADMGERPDGTTLDRIENDRNYEPGNCRWADAKVQSNNRRATPELRAARDINLANGRRYWPRKDTA